MDRRLKRFKLWEWRLTLSHCRIAKLKLAFLRIDFFNVHADTNRDAHAHPDGRTALPNAASSTRDDILQWLFNANAIRSRRSRGRSPFSFIRGRRIPNHRSFQLHERIRFPRAKPNSSSSSSSGSGPRSGKHVNVILFHFHFCNGCDDSTRDVCPDE